MKAFSRSLLLAEDNEDDAFLTARALEAAGISHTIQHCRDGQEVIDHLSALAAQREKLEAHELPELLLLDLKMPRMGGLEALEWIRRHELFKPLIVLALTSSSEQIDVRAAYQLNINAYLVKPSSLTEMIDLARTIREFWLDQDHLIRPKLGFSSPFVVAR